MILKLVMIRCPDNVVPEQREIRGGEFNIGRSPDNDWPIADPDRHLSKHHCRVALRAGRWEWEDFSANGTYLNQASTPIGGGQASTLRNGDRIRFGDYELEVTLDDDAAAFDRDPQRRGYDARLSDDLNPFDTPPAYGRGDGMRLLDIGMGGVGGGFGGGNAAILPPDFDPLAPNEEPFTGPTQADHAPALDSAFRPPPPLTHIPDDFDFGLDPPVALAHAQSMPIRAPSAAPPPSMVAPIAAPIPTPAATMAAPAASDSRLVAAFLRGAGLDDAALADPEKTMERIGAAMRAAVSGLRKTLMARAAIKDTFRIEQTMIQATGNNPLKFSIDDDDAMSSLLGLGRRVSLAAEVAVAEALLDIRLHELATTGAMQAAARKLLEQLDPVGIERTAGGTALDILPSHRKARAWDAFAHLHQTMTQALSDNFDSVFGKAFARAYEQAMAELSAREPKS